MVDAVLARLGSTANVSTKGGTNSLLFRPFFVGSFDGEEVLDAGGATAELYSLFFEQLQSKTITIQASPQV